MIRIFTQGFTASLLIAVVVLLWLTLTESGLQWTLQQVNTYLPEKIIAEKIQGKLIGPMTFSEVQYQKDGINLHANQIDLDWNLSSLLSNSININQLHIKSLKLISTKSDNDNPSQVYNLNKWDLPWHIILSNVEIDNFDIEVNGQHNNFKQLSLNVSSLLNTINIKSFSFLTNSYKLNIKGKLLPNKNYQHDFGINWQVELPSNLTLTGSGQLKGNLQNTKLTQSLSGPLQGSINANISDLLRKIKWQANINIKKIDATSLNINSPNFSGELDLNGSGSSNTATLTGNLKEIKITSSPSLNHLIPQKHDAKLKIQLKSFNKTLDIQQFEYTSPYSELNIKGQVTNSLNLDWSFSTTNLNEFYSNVDGNFIAQGNLTGLMKQPVITTSVAGKNIKIKEYKIGTLNIDLKSTIFNWQQTNLNAKATSLDLNGIKIKSLDINANSKTINIKSLSENDVSGLFKAKGQFVKNNWQGQVIHGAINTKNLGDWKLKAPVSLNISDKSFSIESICLNNNQNGEICSSLHHENTIWVSDFRLSSFPLQLFSPWLPPDLKIEGEVNSNLNFKLMLPNKLLGQGKIVFPAGKLSYPLLEGERESWNYTGGSFEFSLTDKGIYAQSGITISENERFQFKAELPDAQLLSLDYNQQTISAWLKFTADNLGLIEALLPESQDIKGNLKLDLSIAGTLKQPLFTGQASLKDAEVKIPRLGLLIDQISFNAKTNKSHIDSILSARSGEGKITIKSNTIFDALSDWVTNIRIQGNDFNVSQIPEAQILISPDLQLKVQKNSINVTGDIDIPYAKLEAKNISTVARVSDDAVIVGTNQPVHPKWLINSNIRLTLGERVHFYGYGFEGRLGGNLLLQDEPGQFTKAIGEINIPEGRYRAYGQRLIVEHGRLLYTGGPLTNPGLDLQAVRRINLITTGVKVRGSLNKPEMELFSIPSMGQTDALSYLLLGRPLNDTSSEENAMMAKAALALGLSGGDKLARVMSGKLGLDEMRVESNDTEDNASLVMGRYLSPKLYISYGVGLIEAFNTFSVRYQVSEKWQLKAISGEHQGADILYTIDL